MTSGTVAGGAATASFSLAGLTAGGYTIDATYNPAAAKGPCDHDVPLNFGVGGVYKIPDLGAGQLGAGWQSAIAIPLTVLNIW